MKKLFIIANWKSNETTPESNSWIQEFSNVKLPISHEAEKEVIICPPFTLLAGLKNLIVDKDLGLKLGAQDISPFAQGAHTGEINAQEVKEFADYVIIGHSERRLELGEDDSVISEKVKRALEAELTPIFCVQGIDTPVPDGVSVVAYEPVSAIGTGKADTPEDAERVAKTIKEKYSYVQHVLYGGSVRGGNVAGFTQGQFIDGVLVGGASLDADKFIQIVKNS